MATLQKGKIILVPNEASKLFALIHLTRAKRSFDIAPLRNLEDFEKKSFVDIGAPEKDMLIPEEVAQYLRKSLSWVYKNWRILGGRKLRGSLFFPKKEELYEFLFYKREGGEIRIYP